MLLNKPIQRTREIYAEYPSQFWVVVGASFVDRVGGALLFPFFALYITKHFGVGMTQVGLLYTFFSAANIIGNTVGGAMTDYLGRKKMIILGLIISATTSLGMGFVNRLELFYLMCVISGLFAQAAGPAQQAMLTDLLPEEKRAEGFGVMRVAMNLAVAIGPAIGGLLASYSYLFLFGADTISSLITAFIVQRTVRETRPETEENQANTGLLKTFQGYIIVLRDRPFVLFVIIYLLMTLVYTQMYSTLSVFLRDVHSIPEQGFGMIMTLNASMVVLLQFWITRRLSGYAPLLLMTAGAFLYSIGFGMYGFVNLYALFLLAMVIITVGEMIIAPVAQAMVGDMAPEDMRGRYMGVMGFSWMIPGLIGPYVAGLLMDNGDPNWVWYGAGIIGLIATVGFFWLHNQVDFD